MKRYEILDNILLNLKCFIDHEDLTPVLDLDEYYKLMVGYNQLKDVKYLYQFKNK